MSVNKIEISNKLSCYHCGDDCPDNSITIDNKIFCCSGCKTVYEILDQKNLCNYYSIESSPGSTQKEPRNRNFAYLNDTDTESQLLDFKDDKISSVTFFIPSIHCSSCIWLLENLYKLNESIYHSEVNFLEKEVTLKFYHNKISLEETAELLTSIGYEPQIQLDSLEKKRNSAYNKKLYYKIGIAAFCFGNIMLFSFPEYLSIDLTETFFKKFFGFLNLLLALPVFFYSASGYFISAYKGIKKRFFNIDVPISLGIIALFTRSAYEIITFTGAGYFDSLSGLVLFLLIGKLFQEKTYQSLNFERNYKSYFPLAVTKKDGEEENSISVSKLKIGDRILVRRNELIPADAVLINGNGSIDYSFVTGESNPVDKVSGEMIYAGGRQLSGLIELEVIKEVSQSYLTRLWNNETFSKKDESYFENFTDKVSKYFTAIILFIAFGAAIFWLPVSSSVAVKVFTSVLIVACPCALALSVPFTLGNALRIYGKNKLYLKNTHIIEKLGKVNHIVFDKTGTITEPGKADLIYEGELLSQFEQDLIKSLVRNSTHPLSTKIAQSIKENCIYPVTGFKEIAGKGLQGTVYGRFLKIGSQSYIVSSEDGKKDYLKSKIFISFDDKIKGHFSVSNSYRENINPVITKLQNGYKVSLLSGDNEGEKENLMKMFVDEEQLKFNQSPQDKLDFIKDLQKKNKKVLMIGDGLNDAGALSQSEVGIAVTENITNFTPASDGILDSSSLVKILQFLDYSKSSINVIFISFIISFLYNIVGLSFAVQGLLSPIIAAILMPLSSVSVVLFATISTNLLAKRRGLSSQLS